MTDTVQFAKAVGSASAPEAHRLRQEARAWLAGLDMDDDARGEVLMAVNEAVENAVEHAYPSEAEGTVELVLWVERDAVNLQVTDHGRWRDAPSAPGDTGDAGAAATPAPSPRGRGIVLMHRSVDSVAIRHDAEGTVVALRHHRDLDD